MAPATTEGDGISPTPRPSSCGNDAGQQRRPRRTVDDLGIPHGSTSLVTGTACAGATVEVYKAVADGDASDTSGGTDYGEGVAYLGSTTADGSGDWSLGSIAD